MGRRKKNINVELKLEQYDLPLTEEVKMSETQTLDSLETEIDKARAELEATKLEIAEKKKQLEITPLRKLEDDEVVIMKRMETRSVASEGLRQKIAQQKAYDSEMVTGKFINRRHPGKVSEKLTYMKYETDPVKWYDFCDGKVYTIPRGFSDQINNDYYSPHFIQKTQALDPNQPASSIHDVDTSNKKYAFVPVNF
jgi:hypothetical protein